MRRQVTPVRKITRSVHESARDVARDIAKTRLYRRSGKGGFRQCCRGRLPVV